MSESSPPSTQVGAIESGPSPGLVTDGPSRPGLVGHVHRLEPAHVPASRLVALVTTGIFTALAAVGSTVLWVAADDLPSGGKIGIVAGIFTLVAAMGLLGFIWPGLELRYTRWRVSAEGIEIKRGVVWRHVVNVPRSRIQHTDVAQGPIERRFGLSTLIVHTAGTHEYEVNLEGIARVTALALRDYLLETKGGDGA